jgi:cytochrome c553
MPKVRPAVGSSAMTFAVMLAACTSMLQAAEEPGRKIYLQKCVSCHGQSGEGVKGKYDKRLIGDKSVHQLAATIAETMPEDEPGACTGPDADAVAKYIHDAFYSATARARNKPARIDVARLTVSQYRHSVADLFGSFRFPPEANGQPGLKGEYFNAGRMQRNQRVIERVDAQVVFEFGQESPDKAKIKKDEFAARWQGSVFAPTTGDYEFILKTENGARLWVNDDAKPAIDAWVRSGKNVETRGVVRLLAGRTYSLRLEFFKSKKAKETSASINLWWKPPHGVDEPIPARCLTTARSPELFVSTAPFPPDDRSLGWERGTAVSKAWDQATTDGALEAADYLHERLERLAGYKEGAPDGARKLREFAVKFVERAFRKPIAPDVRKAYVDRLFDETSDPTTALRRVVLLTLKSPRFLYRDFSAESDQWEIASRLALELWDSIPDEQLRKAAASGRLKTPGDIRKQADRMIADQRAKGKLRSFFHHWLKIDGEGDVVKDPKRFPGFDKAVVADLRTSLDLLVDEAGLGEKSDFRRLLTADEVYVNGRLAKFYGAKAPDANDFKPIVLDAGKRSGVLAHPYILSSFAYSGETSPIHRGVFLARGILGLGLRPPPEAVAPLAPSLHPGMTTRERVALQTKPEACQTCHTVINPLGFALEHFDAVGRFRDKDQGKPINATGEYLTRDGKRVTFSTVDELAKFLVSNPETHEAFVEQLFHHLVQQPVRAYGADRMETLRKAFVAGDFNVRKLAVEIAVSTVAAGRRNEPKSIAQSEGKTR